MTGNTDYVLGRVAQAIVELDAEHRPMWATNTAQAAGKKPVGCAICWPSDGHWPCTTRMIADDLRVLISSSIDSAKP